MTFLVRHQDGKLYLTGVRAAFLDIIEEYNLYIYKLTNPRGRTSKVLRIKKLKVLVNESFNPQHSTYLIVEQIKRVKDKVKIIRILNICRHQCSSNIHLLKL